MGCSNRISTSPESLRPKRIAKRWATTRESIARHVRVLDRGSSKPRMAAVTISLVSLCVLLGMSSLDCRISYISTRMTSFSASSDNLAASGHQWKS